MIHDHTHVTQATVELPHGGTVTDPVCGMTVDPATAPGHRGTGAGTAYFCLAGCAAAYDADPGLHAAAAAAAPAPGHGKPTRTAPAPATSVRDGNPGG